jgi:F0F1-type ATP synthase assembly protein I
MPSERKIRNQESGVRSQESGVRSQESGDARMQLAVTVGSVVLAGILVVALVGFLFEKYAGKLEP